jgi:hypothetical protein
MGIDSLDLETHLISSGVGRRTLQPRLIDSDSLEYVVKLTKIDFLGRDSTPSTTSASKFPHPLISIVRRRGKSLAMRVEVI